MKHLVLLVHVPLSVRHLYSKALEQLGEVELTTLNAGAYSSAYSATAERFRDHNGRILPRLLANQRQNLTLPYKSFTIISFSAGYALVREMLKNQADANAIDAYIAIDSIHSGFEAPGNPLDSQLMPFVRLAERAKRGQALFWLGHSDVKTPQTGKTAFASTTQVAQEIEQLAEGQSGNFVVRIKNVRDKDTDEHTAALCEWGPEMVREALVPFLTGVDPEAPTLKQAPPWRNPSLPLRERCLLLSLDEMRWVREEPPGSNTSHRIREYLAGCISRDTGRQLGLRAASWCAASASWVALQCVLDGERIPHSWRAAGVDIQKDARANGSWREAKLVRAGAWTPKPGDLAIFTRGDPRSWTRHVARVESPPSAAGIFSTIGGNEDSQWRRTSRNLSDIELLGFVDYEHLG